MAERKFIYDSWEYSVEKFQALAKRKPYAERFRLEYYHLLRENTKTKKMAKDWVINALSVFKLFMDIMTLQLRGRPVKWGDKPVVALVTKNNVYLQNIKPLLIFLAENGTNLKIFCPQKHYGFIKNILGEQVSAHLYAIEGFNYQAGFFTRLLKLPASLIAAFYGTFWLAFQPVKKRFWFSAVFGRYAITEYFFGKQLRLLFKSGAKLIAANDHWMWESLFFTAARDANALSYVLEHGVIGDTTYPIFARQFLAWGQYDAEKLKNEYGARPDEVRIVGSPHFDNVFEKITKHKTTVSQFDKPFITFLSQYFFGSNSMEPGYYQQIIDRFCALAPLAERFGKQLVIKLHPSDKIKYYAGLPENVTISTDPLLDVLDKTCMAFTVDSTAIFESMMYGIPTCQCGVAGMIRLKFNFIVSAEGYLNSYEEIALFAENLLGNAIQYETRVKEGMTGLSKYYYDLGSNSSVKRVFDLLN